MSQENVERIRAGFEAFNRTGEITTDHLAPDFELHQASSIVDTAGVFRGPDAFQDAVNIDRFIEGNENVVWHSGAIAGPEERAGSPWTRPSPMSGNLRTGS